jgi:hypothetical protein
MLAPVDKYFRHESLLVNNSIERSLIAFFINVFLFLFYYLFTKRLIASLED